MMTDTKSKSRAVTPPGAELICLQGDDRKLWLKNRCGGIGSSDAPFVAGIKAFKKTIHDVWAEKCGIAESDFDETRDHIIFGQLLEPIIATEFTRRNGYETFGGGELLRSKVRPWQQATCDRFIEIDGNLQIVEIKTSSSFNVDSWSGDEPPKWPSIQIQHQFAVTGLTRGFVVCLLGGNKYIQFEVKRNDDFITWLNAKEKAFWNSVETRCAPALDESTNSTRLLNLLFPAKTPEPAPAKLGSEVIDWTEHIIAMDLAIKEMQAERDLLKNKIREQIGESWRGELPDGSGEWFWKPDKRGRRVTRFKKCKSI